MVSYYHQVYSHTVFSLTHSPIHVIPVNTPMVSYYHQVITHCSERTCAPTHTPMVSYYHQVYPLTALRECLFPLTLPWCRTTTKSSLTPTPILVLPLTPMSSHTLLPSLHFTSFSPPTHPNSSPTLSHPSCLHHIIITSSPLPITYHHQSLPLTPHNTPNPSISLPTLPIVS